MRPAEVVARGARYLERHGVDSPEANAEQLMMSVLGVDRVDLFGSDRALTATEAKAFGRALCRRCTGTPLQHLTGSVGFRGLTLEVREGVFVPRPETEILVEVALEKLRGPSHQVVDACTGSGAVALAIARERSAARVVATDLSPDAVALARANAAANGLDVDVRVGDLLVPVLDDLTGRVDLVTCNPPYLRVERREELPPDVAAEPELALFGDDEIYARLFSQAVDALRPGGWVVVEIEESRATQVSALARDAGFVDVDVHEDLTGRPRVVGARRP